MLGQHPNYTNTAVANNDFVLNQRRHASLATSSHLTHLQSLHLLDCLSGLEPLSSVNGAAACIPSQNRASNHLVTYSQMTATTPPTTCTTPTPHTIPTWLPNGLLGTTTSSSPARATGALPPVSELRPAIRSSGGTRLLAVSTRNAYSQLLLNSTAFGNDTNQLLDKGSNSVKLGSLQQSLYPTETSVAYSEAALSHLVTDPPIVDGLASNENQLQPLVQVESMLDIASLYSTLDHQYSSSMTSQLNIPNGGLGSDQHLGDLVADALSSLEKSGKVVQEASMERALEFRAVDKSTSSETQQGAQNAPEGDDPVVQLVEEVKCYRCKSCSYLSLDRVEVIHHVRSLHSTAYDASERPRFVSRPPQLPQISSQIKKLVHTTRSTEKRFLCGKCRRGFFTLDECCQHLTLDHQAKSKKVRLEWIYANKPEEVRAATPVTDCVPLDAADQGSAANGTTRSMLGSGHVQKGTSSAVGAPTSKKSLPKGSKTHMSSSQKAWQKKVIREQGSFICEFKGCNVRFKEFANLEYHRRCHSMGVGSENGEQEMAFGCPECGARTQYWRSMASHLWRLHYCDMELHACDQCNFRTYSLSKLENLHKRIHGEERPFLCDTCGKGFKTIKQLRNHKVTHAKALHLHSCNHVGACEICGRRFGDRRVLQLHMDAVHRGARPFLCSYCGYSTSCRSSLKIHLRQHTGEKPFACDICDYRSADHNSMRRHKMRHSGTKPYKCPYCPYACIQSNTYKSHLHKKHPDESGSILFACPQCPFRTVKEDNYRTHLTSHSNGLDTSKDGAGRRDGRSSSPDQESLTLGQIVGLAHSAGVGGMTS